MAEFLAASRQSLVPLEILALRNRPSTNNSLPEGLCRQDIFEGRSERFPMNLGNDDDYIWLIISHNKSVE